MIQIPLTRGKVATIDDEDAALVRRYKWYAVNLARKGEEHWYAQSSLGGKGGNWDTRRNGGGRSKQILLHVLLMGKIPGKEIDHKDRNGLNCTRDNLRHVTRSQNNMNHRMITGNVSGFRGVTILKDHPRSRPWLAQLAVNGKTVFRGYFCTAIEGAKAYNEASLKYHGEFGYRNLIP